MVSGIVIVLIFILVISTLRSFTTLFHELGHAIPALWFTPGLVEVFVGSYGSINNGMAFKLGRLLIRFKINFMSWNIGLCRHLPSQNNFHDRLIILGGPCASLLLGTFTFWISFGFENITVKIILLAYCFSSLFDFLVNILPSELPLELYDQTISYNDGFQLKRNLAISKYPNSYHDLMGKKSQISQTECLTQLETIRFDIQNKYWITKSIIGLLTLQNRHFEALEEYQQLELYYKLKHYDYIEFGDILMQLDRFNAAIEKYSQFLYYHFSNKTVLLRRAKAYELNDQKELAALDLSRIKALGGIE